jgi:hypothetical protein
MNAVATRRAVARTTTLLAAHGIPSEKIFAEEVSTRVRVRPKFEAALDACREIKAVPRHCRVILGTSRTRRRDCTFNGVTPEE